MERARYRRTRIILIAIDILLFIVLLVMIASKLAGGDDTTATRESVSTKNTAGDTPAQSAGSQFSDRNQQRKVDAEELSRKVSAFKGRNNSRLPTAYTNGNLTGSGITEPLSLTFYRDITFATGHNAPLAKDGLVLVGDARCAENASTEASSAPTHDYVIQYIQETSSGTFVPQCLVS